MTVIECLRNGYAVLGSDEVRRFHPALDEGMACDLLSMDVLSNEPVPYWMWILINYARDHGYSTIIENRLSNPEFVAAGIAKLLAAGFRVCIVALAVVQEVSPLGVVQHFLGAQRV